MLMLFRALPIVWQIATGAAVIAAIGGAFTYWTVHERNIGWQKAVDAIAAKDKEALHAVRQSISRVEECSRSGRTWDTVSGMCE